MTAAATNTQLSKNDPVFEKYAKGAVERVVVPKDLQTVVKIENGRVIFKAATRVKLKAKRRSRR